MGRVLKKILALTTGILLLAAGSPVLAQSTAPGGLSPDFLRALMGVFWDSQSFHGRATLDFGTNAAGNPVSVGCAISVFGRGLRVETDSFNPGANVPPLEAARLRAMHAISIVRPDLNRIYMVFPMFQSYVEMAYGKTGSDPAPPPKVEKTAVGPESVGTQPCVKSRLAITEGSGQRYDVTVWNAKDWNGFPIQIQAGSPKVSVAFDDLHLDAPAGNLFEPPANYTKYEGIQEIIRHNAEKTQNATP